MAGFRKFFDKVTEWEWYKTPFMFHLFSHLILKANYKDEEVNGITVKRGQLVTSLRELSEETGISIRSIRTCLARLEATQEVTQFSTHRFSVITICKFDDYQDAQQEDRHTDRHTERHTDGSFPFPPTTPFSISNFIDDIDITNNLARAREETPLFYISSTMKDFYRGNPKGLVDEKIRRIRERLVPIASEIGMPPDEQEKFIRYWSEHDDGSTTLRAERVDVFNLRERAVRWMERNKPVPTRSERNAEELKKFNALFEQYEQYPNNPEYQ